jgi:hypothetical protein
VTFSVQSIERGDGHLTSHDIRKFRFGVGVVVFGDEESAMLERASIEAHDEDGDCVRRQARGFPAPKRVVLLRALPDIVSGGGIVLQQALQQMAPP